MSDSWDEFSIAVAEKLPRRESLRRLGLAVAAAVLAPLGLEGAGRKILADPCKAFCKCRNPKQQKQCLAACNACDKVTANLHGTCGSYTCCGSGTTKCGVYCADLDNDFENCGACGNYCRYPDAYESAACVDGRCEYWCVEGADNCNGHCTPLDRDYENCGACGIVCSGSTPYCIDGVCSQCQPGLVACGAVCTDLNYDNSNCGACGNVCGGSTPYCIAGTCYECPPGSGMCGGRCIDLSWDGLNCGACNHQCQPQEFCSWGVCEGYYDPGYGYGYGYGEYY